jgi:N-acetylglucosamine malate deacetylase 1
MTTVDVLAIGPHRDDVELTCGGTLIRAADNGSRTGVVDLTAGELGSRGSAKIREAEAARAAEVLGLAVRECLGLPDGGIENNPASRESLARLIRRLRPRVVIAPALQGRHPDHVVAAQLVRDACFVAGLAKVAPDVDPHRPHKVIHAVSYRHDAGKPTFVVDVTDQLDRKIDAVRCYGSQFEGVVQAGEVYPNGEPLLDVVRHYAAYYGTMIRSRYGEPFFTVETMRVDDVLGLEVATY